MTNKDSRGRFIQGNQAAVGHGRKRTPWADLWMEALTEKDFKAIVKSIVSSAKGGDMRACMFVIQKCLGNSLEITTPPQQDAPYVTPEELRAKLLVAVERAKTEYAAKTKADIKRP